MPRMRLKAIIAVLLLAMPGVVNATAEYRVGQKDKVFSVAVLSIKPGDRVTFDNDDQTTHNVYSSQKGLTSFSFNLKSQAPGTSATVVFDKEGTYEIRCAFHAKMKLVITVKK